MISFGPLYRRAMVVFAVLIFFTNVSDYTERYGVIPLAWIGLFFVLSAPAFMNGIAVNRVPLRPVIWWGAAYLAISFAWFYGSPQDDFAFEEVQKRVLSVIVLVLALIVFGRREEQALAQRCIAVAVLMATALNVYELFNPLTFSTIPGRSSGLYTNVNQSGAAIVLGLILSYRIVPDRLKVAFIGITAIGLIPTFSRSAIIGWALVVAYYFLRAGVAAQIRRTIVLSTVCIVLVFSPVWSGIQYTLEERGVLTLNVLERVAFFTGGRVDDASTSERQAVAANAWRMYGEQPIGGWGTGASRRMDGFDVGTHNIYLAMLVDHGVLGFLIVPFLLLSVLWGLNRRTIDVAAPWLLFMVVWGFFSHNVLEERYILIAVALVASMVASNRTAPATAAEPAFSVPTAPTALPASAA
jgi:hypothetical protein